MVLSGCDAVKQTITDKPTLSDAQITKLIPKRVNNAKLWATDIGDIFDELSLPKTAQNICTAIAVIDQESNFHADPSVPNLGNAALKAIDDKLEDKLGKIWQAYFATCLRHAQRQKQLHQTNQSCKTENSLMSYTERFLIILPEPIK